MGGNVAITVKEPNGNMWKMDRWTNIVPYYFSNINLYNGNFSHWLKDFTKQWLVMKEDYETNKAKGNFTENMTPVYFPFDTTSPSEYGLIVVDAQKKKIYSAQDYTSVGKFGIHHLQDEESFENFQKLVDAGFIKSISYVEVKNPHEVEQKEALISEPQIFASDIHAIINSGFSFFEEQYPESVEFQQTLHEPLKSIKRFNLFNCFIQISSDWEVFSVPVNNSRATSCLILLSELIKDDWSFTDEDYVAWQNYLLSYLDYDDDKDLTNINEFNKLVPTQWHITQEMIDKVSKNE